MSKPVIKIAGVTVPHGLEKDALLRFLVENKALLIAEKKQAIKYADAVSCGIDLSKSFFIDDKGALIKAATDTAPQAPNQAQTVLCVINTTNWLDSHGDVHIPGIWKKSLKDNATQIHLQEHTMSFTNIISDEAKGYTQKIAWKELGLNLPGETEALIFASPLTGRNPYMEEQYRKGFVKNHSVGMRYVTIKLCVNEAEEEYYKEEFANWQTYFPMVANAADAEAQGFFWAVLEAKVIEGSAVVKGSNIITPTIGFKSVQPENSTEQPQPVIATEVKEEKPTVDWDKIANKIYSN
jgi:hypothetical protein